MPKKPKASGERRIEYMALDQLRPADRNPKAHDIGEIHKSMGRFGYVEAIALDERTGKLVAGHGRAETLARMQRDKKPPPDGVRVDKEGRWLVPVQRGWASKNDKDALAYLLASNQLGVLGGWDEPLQLEALGDLALDDALEGTGFDGDDVEALRKRLDGSGSTTPEIDFDAGLKFQIIVECAGEQEQAKLLERFQKEGLKCRALML